MKKSQEIYFQEKTTKQENLPLDKVLSQRQNGKKLPERFSSESQGGQSTMPKKLKPISKEKNQNVMLEPQVSSTDLAKKNNLQQGIEQQINAIDFRQNFRHKESEVRYKQKFTEKVRQNLVQTIFRHNYPMFVKIIQAYNLSICSTFLLNSIYSGFELSWMNERFDSIEYYNQFLKFYCEKLPNCLNKKFANFMKESVRMQKDGSLYSALRKSSLEYVRGVIRGQTQKIRSLPTNNEKTIPLVVSFELQNEVKLEQLVKIVPLSKINEYIDNNNANFNSSNLIQENKKYQSAKMDSSPDKQISSLKDKVTTQPLIHHSIIELLGKNNLKQVEKIIRANRIPYTNYPEFVQKLEIKYLEYIERTYPIYMIDELINDKISLVQNMVEIYLKRRKYQEADHFIHKYKLKEDGQCDHSKIFNSPLIVHDSFGPTQSYVLNNKPEDYFLGLRYFNIHKVNVIWIDSLTIYQKPHTSHLKKLLQSKQIGLDSQSSSAIHVFQKTKLQLIQIYEPQINIVFLFDVRDFKNDKKKRQKRKSPEQKKKADSSKLSNLNAQTKFIKNQTKGKSFSINVDSQNQQKQSKKADKIAVEANQEENRTWYRFSKVIENVFKNSTIYGHALHSDMADIISELSLGIKAQSTSLKDSQVEFKKYFPQQTKSKLSFLAQKCFQKEISKYEQCSAWDKRPLRKAQMHYAALDAVLPYKLVKWMQENNSKKKQ